MSEHLYVVNVEVAIVRGDRYLMVLRSEAEAHAGGTLSFPGGKVDPQDLRESILEETAIREAREEVGLEITALRYVESKSFRTADGIPVVDVVFLARSDAGEAIAGEPDEVAALMWLTADQVLEHERTPTWTARSVRRAEAARAGGRQPPAATSG